MPLLFVADFFPGHEHRCVRSCRRATQGLQLVPGGGGKQNSAGLAALAEGGYLAGIAAFLYILPLQITKFGNTQPSGIQQPQQNAVPSSWFQGQHLLHVRFLEDALGQAAAEAGEPKRCPHVYGEDSDPVSEGEEGFDTGESPGAGRGGQIVLSQHIGKSLDVGEGNLGEWFASKEEESSGVGLVGALGMYASSMEPETDELGVGVLLAWRCLNWVQLN